MKLIHEGRNGTKIYRDGDKAYKRGRNAEKEYALLKDFCHPNIIKVFGFGEDIFEMEYFEGVPLVAPNDTQLAELKSAIEYIHSKGIKHNDLMGYNILEDGITIKIIDFGNAGPADKFAQDVEGCKREDGEMYKLYETNNNIINRRV